MNHVFSNGGAILSMVQPKHDFSVNIYSDKLSIPNSAGQNILECKANSIAHLVNKLKNKRI